MLRWSVLLLALTLTGCGGSSPTAPALPPPTTLPPAPPIPSMLGTWAGAYHSHVSTRIPIPGVRRVNSTTDCTTTWLITQQSGINWRGNYTVVGHPNCEGAGAIGGTVHEGRVVTMGRADAVFTTELGPCRLVYNDTMWRGSMSPDGGSLNLAVDYIERCSYPPGDLDFTVNGTFTLTRR